MHTQFPAEQVLPLEHTVDAEEDVHVPGWQMCVTESQRCPPQNPVVDSQRGKQNPSPVVV